MTRAVGKQEDVSLVGDVWANSVLCTMGKQSAGFGLGNTNLVPGEFLDVPRDVSKLEAVVFV